MLKTRSKQQSLVWLLLLLALLNAIDYFATQDLIARGLSEERNPLMRNLVGTAYFPIYKLVLIPLGLMALWLARESLFPKYFPLVKLTCVLYAVVVTYTLVVFYL